jgi:hypothetical protein
MVAAYYRLSAVWDYPDDVAAVSVHLQPACLGVCIAVKGTRAVNAADLVFCSAKFGEESGFCFFV